MIRTVLVGIQAATFVGVAGILFYEGNWRLASAQVMLGVITGLVYL